MSVMNTSLVSNSTSLDSGLQGRALGSECQCYEGVKLQHGWSSQLLGRSRLFLSLSFVVTEFLI